MNNPWAASNRRFFLAMRKLIPPLPFTGNKFRWHRILKPLILDLKPHAVVFDAFAGSFAVSRMIKDLRPDVVCIANDCMMYYRQRLECVDDTNAILDRMRAAGAYLKHGAYERYDPDVEKTLLDIASEARDQLTIQKNLMVAPNTIRAKCTNINYDADLCKSYCKDCVIIDEVLDASKARYYAQSCDLVVLDPPYEICCRSWIDSQYIQRTQEAQDFCKGIIASGCAYWLFERPGSTLMQSALDSGAISIEYDGKRNRQHALEALAVHSKCATAAQKKSPSIPNETGEPVQLSLF